MSFNKYYQDELVFLREMGREFARRYPAAGRFLGEPGSDPDVERLLEGFAFLTGRVRQKLDDEFPELTTALMELLWPHYLRPVPSFSILEFEPIHGAVRTKHTIPRRTVIDSIPVEETPCHFSTCFDVDIYPLGLDSISLRSLPGELPQLFLSFRCASGYVAQSGTLGKTRLFLHGESRFLLYLWLCRHSGDIFLKSGAKSVKTDCRIVPAGFSSDESLTLYPATSFDGYRLLQEYFCFPEKYLFVELENLTGFELLDNPDSFDVIIQLTRPVPSALRPSRGDIRLYCTPVVNLFEHDADPIRVEHDKVEYRVRPAGRKPLHYECYSVNSVTGFLRGESYPYRSFFSFEHSTGVQDRVGGRSDDICFQCGIHESVHGDGTDSFISFVNTNKSAALPESETIELKITCTNRSLAGKLGPGDICVPTDKSPEFAKFKNITTVTPRISPPIDGALYWRLVSHLSINHLSVSTVKGLKGILSLYNFQSFHDRRAANANEMRINGLCSVKSEPAVSLLGGAPVRGIDLSVELLEDHFANEGDMYLFASVLERFLSLCATVNSFTRLTVRGSQKGDVYKWPPRMGLQAML